MQTLTNARDRVVQEQRELHERLVKLTAFLNSDKFESLTSQEQSLLRTQFNIMAAYDEVLQQRLEVWRNEIWPTIE